MGKHLNIHASKHGITEIDIFGQIGESFFEEGNTLESVKAEIGTRSKDELHFNIASLGGDAFEGLAIHDLVALHPKKTVMNIVGATASAGAVISQAADETNITENSLFLVHKARTIAGGTADDMESAAGDLKKVDARMLSVFAKSTEKPEAEIKALMDEDKFIDANEAIEMGFVDKKIEARKIAAKVDLKMILASKVLSDAQKEQLKAQYGEAPEAPVPAAGFDFSSLNTALESLVSVIKGFKNSDSGKDVTILDETAVTTKLEEVTNEITAAKGENKTLTDKNAEHVISIEALTKSEKALKDEIAKLNGSQDDLGGNDGDPTGDKDAEGKGSFGNFIKSGALKRLKSA